jgi:hypothetical protein
MSFIRSMPPQWTGAALLAVLTSAASSCARHDELNHSGTASAQNAPLDAPEAERHLLLTLKLTQAGLTVVDFREVAQRLPRARGHEDLPWRLQIDDASGHALSVAPIPQPPRLRGEVAGPDGELQPFQPSGGEQSFAVRLPVLPAAAHVRLLAPAPGASIESWVERAHAALPNPIHPNPIQP